jgi:hypothetical protein
MQLHPIPYAKLIRRLGYLAYFKFRENTSKKLVAEEV